MSDNEGGVNISSLVKQCCIFSAQFAKSRAGNIHKVTNALTSFIYLPTAIPDEAPITIQRK